MHTAATRPPTRGPPTRVDSERALLEPCAAQVLRADRYRRAGPQEMPGLRHPAGDAGSRVPDDALFAIELEINDMPPAARLVALQEHSRPLVAGLRNWLASEHGKMFGHTPVAKAFDYLFRDERWVAFTRFLDDGRVRSLNNAAERSLPGAAFGGKSWFFVGSERGGDRAAFMYTPIVTEKMNDIDPRAWLADVLARPPDTRISRMTEVLPLNWRPTTTAPRKAAKLRPRPEDYAIPVYAPRNLPSAAPIRPRTAPESRPSPAPPARRDARASQRRRREASSGAAGRCA